MSDSQTPKDETNLANITAFFEHKNIFLTGATGFFGKVLLSEILRTLPRLSTLYILIRSKENQTPSQRFCRSILSSPVFKKLRSEKSNFDQFISTRVKILNGDSQNFGLSMADYKDLVENVHFIISNASTVKFDMDIKETIINNVLPSIELMKMAQKCPKIENFLFHSSGMATCGTGIMDEQIVQVDYDIEDYISRVLSMTKEEIKVETALIEKLYGNTYLYGKRITECLFHQLKGQIPLTIFRTPFVGPALSNPLAGWFDARNGLIPIYGLIGVGKLDMIYATQAYHEVPVDILAGRFIVGMALFANRGKTTIIYSNFKDPLPISKVLEMAVEFWKERSILGKDVVCRIYQDEDLFQKDLKDRKLKLQASEIKDPKESTALRWNEKIHQILAPGFSRPYNHPEETSSMKIVSFCEKCPDAKIWNVDMDKIDKRNYILSCCEVAGSIFKISGHQTPAKF